MIKTIYKTLFAIIIIFYAQQALCQTRTDTIRKDTSIKKDTSTKKGSIKFAADYISNNVFMGRTTPTRTPIFAPNAKYTFKQGFYLSGTLDYLPNNKNNSFDGGDLAVGYDFDLSDDLSAGTSFTKLFYANNSTQIGSAISSTINGYLDYDIASVVTVTVSADFNSNKPGVNNDFFYNFGLSHDFIAEKLFDPTDLILISPTVIANIGTQNFYDAFIVKKVFKTKKQTAQQNALIAAFEKTLNKSQLLDYELSLPIEYKVLPLIFQIIPTYAIVKNGFTAASAKLLGLSNATGVFYFTIGAALKF